MNFLQYPLPALTLTKAECADLVAPIHAIGLPRSHICRKFPKDLVYGYSSSLCLGLDDLYVDQEVSHAETYMEHLHADTLT